MFIPELIELVEKNDIMLASKVSIKLTFSQNPLYMKHRR
jgi:hypothetical protein